MLHEGLVWKISTGGASPLRGAGPWRSYSCAPEEQMKIKLKYMKAKEMHIKMI